MIIAMSATSRTATQTAVSTIPRRRGIDAAPVVALAGYCTFSLLLLVSALHQTANIWVYPLDDVYITMSMARNFALHGVWGVTPDRFASSASSPLYVLLVSAIDRVGRASDYTPLALSFLFGALAIFVVAHWTRHSSPFVRWSALVGIVMGVPLHVVGLLGMEHTLQIALVLLFAEKVSHLVRRDRDFVDWQTALLSAAIVATRFESLFLIAASVAWLLWQRKFRLSACVLIAGIAPVAAYAVVSVSHGWSWLPAPVLLKGARLRVSWGALEDIGGRLLRNILRANQVFVLWITATTVALVQFRTLSVSTKYLVWLTLCTAALHLLLADVGWAYRYEAYLLALEIVTVAFLLENFRIRVDARGGVTIVLIVLSAYLLARRTLRASENLPGYSHAIWAQQYQMSEFLRIYYNGSTVAANDIGAVVYRGGVDCVDLMGLTDRRIAIDRLSGRYRTATIAEEAQANDVRIAIVYADWFTDKPQSPGPPLPRSWIRAGTWTLLRQADLGGRAVTFYALNPAESLKLKTALAEYSGRLPSDVTFMTQ